MQGTMGSLKVLPVLTFEWTIPNLSKHKNKKIYSDIFLDGGYKWRILMFPSGNVTDHLSVYLDVADSSSLPCGWTIDANFSFSIVNQLQNKPSTTKKASHQFNALESDWGFTSFMPLHQFYDPSEGYIVNDTCIIVADVYRDPSKVNGSLDSNTVNRSTATLTTLEAPESEAAISNDDHPFY